MVSDLIHHLMTRDSINESEAHEVLAILKDSVTHGVNPKQVCKDYDLDTAYAIQLFD